jgi:protein-tyrosine phosphatase
MGNICRSPTAEAVFRDYASRNAPDFPVEAESAGTHGYHIGSAPDIRAQQVAFRRGVDMSGLRARLLTVQDFTRFDYILAMDRQNLAAAQALAPAGASVRLQLLLDYLPSHGLREVPDPYYGELREFENVFDLTKQAAVGLLQAMRDPARAGRGSLG